MSSVSAQGDSIRDSVTCEEMRVFVSVTTLNVTDAKGRRTEEKSRCHAYEDGEDGDEIRRHTALRHVTNSSSRNL